ncbi:DEAD/DEAH box helicase family protein [Cardiosporidium cionae]|uniref:DEAD/DEAH box helicase family protein n=1 Tax=Cardiosporidium cionae TaxID=476202 RepID=A0ABQ7J8T7_9APIC|nr:DEAD/DEAH box helicase family protein [Cardiosporidium cionae]|eukprot:KAF8820075.1 DEAD/DEAH box helicase family protein [Cardiosporidium cionae]
MAENGCVKPSVEIVSSQSDEKVTTSTSLERPKSFIDLGLGEELVEICNLLGWKAPTEIQAMSIPYALQGRDIIGLAETGSGKTAAFALPILHTLLNSPQRLYALTLAPTRELCVQIAEQFQALGSTIQLEVATLVGGLDMITQALAIARKPHIIVASPGRLVDHLENTKGFNLQTMKYLVMDEADRLLSMDFEEDLDKILQVFPKQRQTFLFSATMTSKVAKLQKASLKKPIKVTVNSKYDTVKELIQNYLLIPFKYKWTYAVAILKHFQAYSAMVFCNTCLVAKKLAIFLGQFGFSSVCLHGRMTQPQRLAALNSFKAGTRKILVVTEVGSRGLDIPHVDIVLNFDIPLSSKDYIHRVGRTARAGRSGRALSFVTQYVMPPAFSWNFFSILLLENVREN